MKFTKSPFNSFRPSVICPLLENKYFKRHHPSVAFKPGRSLILNCVVTHLQYGTFISRWWFQTFFIFHPENWGRWTHFDDHIFQMGGKKPPTKTIHIAKPCKPCWVHGVFVPVWKKAFCKSHGGSTSPRSAPWLLAEGEVWEMCRLCRLTEWHETEYQGPKPTWNLCSLGLAERIFCLIFFLFHWKWSRDRFVPLGFLQSADFQKIEFKGYI